MTDLELTKIFLGAHAAVLVAAMTAYYKYGDRTEAFKNSLHGINDVISHLRRKIAVGLAVHLKPVFSADPKAIISCVLDQSGNPYSEKAVSPAEGEEYKDAIFDYIEGFSEVIIDYRSLIIAQNSWCKWAKFLSWTTLCLLLWQALMVLLVFWVSIGQAVFPIFIKYSLYITAIIGTICLLQPIPILHNHNIIIEFRRKYYVI